MRAVVALLAGTALWAGGCLEVPDLDQSGRYACAADADCPTGWTCWTRSDGSQRCLDRIECQALTDPACDDGEDCTADVCDLDTASCTHSAAVGAACAPGGCDAAGVFTPPSLCDADGACVGVAAEPCDDGDACSADVCDAVRGGCLHLPDLSLDCGVAGRWHGLFTRIRNDGDRDFRTFALELELDADLPSTWRFETTPASFGGASAIEVTALASGELLIEDLDTELWLNVAPTREVIAGWDFGSIGPIFFVREPEVAPPPDGLAGRWRAFVVERRDDVEVVQSRMFETYVGPLELADSGETACIVSAGAALVAAAPPAVQAPRRILPGACTSLGAKGDFTFQHTAERGGAERRERWRGWVTPARDVGVAVLEVDDGAGGFASPSGFVFLVRTSTDAPPNALDGTYAYVELGHSPPTDRTRYCWGQATVAGGEVTGGVEICNGSGEQCQWRDDAPLTDGAVETAPDGALAARLFANPVLTELAGQAAPLLASIRAAPLAVAQPVTASGPDGAQLATPGSLELLVWQPPGVAPRRAPLYHRDGPWCPAQ